MLRGSAAGPERLVKGGGKSQRCKNSSPGSVQSAGEETCFKVKRSTSVRLKTNLTGLEKNRVLVLLRSGIEQTLLKYASTYSEDSHQVLAVDLVNSNLNVFDFHNGTQTLTLQLNVYRPSKSFGTAAVGPEETGDDYQVPSSSLCLRQAPLSISVPQRYPQVHAGCQDNRHRRQQLEKKLVRLDSNFILLFRYVESSSSVPSDEEKQPQVPELGEP